MLLAVVRIVTILRPAVRVGGWGPAPTIGLNPTTQPKFLTLGVTCKLDNPLDDWLKSGSPTNHPTGYLIRGLTRKLKIW